MRSFFSNQFFKCLKLHALLLHMAIVYVVSFVCTMVGEQVHVGCEEVAELMVLVVIPIVILLQNLKLILQVDFQV